jgi:hypothetical protein
LEKRFDDAWGRFFRSHQGGQSAVIPAFGIKEIVFTVSHHPPRSLRKYAGVHETANSTPEISDWLS